MLAITKEYNYMNQDISSMMVIKGRKRYRYKFPKEIVWK